MNIRLTLGEHCGMAACEAIDHHAGCVQQVDAGKVTTRFNNIERTTK